MLAVGASSRYVRIRVSAGRSGRGAVQFDSRVDLWVRGAYCRAVRRAVRLGRSRFDEVFVDTSVAGEGSAWRLVPKFARPSPDLKYW